MPWSPSRQAIIVFYLPPDPEFDIEFLLYESSAADEGEPEDQDLDLDQGVETSLEAEAWLIGRDIQARVQAG